MMLLHVRAYLIWGRLRSSSAAASRHLRVPAGQKTSGPLIIFWSRWGLCHAVEIEKYWHENEHGQTMVTDKSVPFSSVPVGGWIRSDNGPSTVNAQTYGECST